MKKLSFLILFCLFVFFVPVFAEDFEIEERANEESSVDFEDVKDPVLIDQAEEAESIDLSKIENDLGLLAESVQSLSETVSILRKEQNVNFVAVEQLMQINNKPSDNRKDGQEEITLTTIHEDIFKVIMMILALAGMFLGFEIVKRIMQ